MSEISREDAVILLPITEAGRELIAIDCSAIGGGYVIETNGNGEQVQTEYGQIFLAQPSRFLGAEVAPEDCPMFKEQSVRMVGDFAVCVTCPSASLELKKI